MDRVVGTVEIAGRKIGLGQPCFVIAEAGVNHEGQLERAKWLVEVAAEAKADAVKFQTFSAQRLASPLAPKAAYQTRSIDDHESQLDMLSRLELSPEAFRELYQSASVRNILFLSTPFDEESADFLEALGVPAFKIASGELTNLPVLKHVARKKKPMIVSTGMASLADVEEAVRAIREAGNDRIILLHCVSNYPAEPRDVNLRAMRTMAEAFGVPVGFSDHTPGLEVALAAVALGACVIEKHFTLDRYLPGPDHQVSLEPEELARLVRGIRIVEQALGDGRKEPAASEAPIAAVARRSLVAAENIPRGTVLTERLIAIKRPGTGLSPALRDQVVGRAVKQDVAAGTVLTWAMFE